jgi:hypothetical protein
MSLFIRIQADTNDGDYIEALNPIDPEDLEKIRPLIEAIKAFKPYTTDRNGNRSWAHRHNWPSGEGIRHDLGEKYPSQIYSGLAQEAFEIFGDLVPYGEHGVHTIVEIELLDIASRTKLL